MIILHPMFKVELQAVYTKHAVVCKNAISLVSFVFCNEHCVDTFKGPFEINETVSFWSVCVRNKLFHFVQHLKIFLDTEIN